MNKKSANFIFYISAIIFPLIILRDMIIYGSEIPINDYWEIVTVMLSKDYSFSLEGLFTPMNKHVLVLPKLIYFANIYMFSGNAFGLKYASVIISLIQVLVLFKMAKRSIKDDFKLAVTFLLISCYCFTPLDSQNFMFGMGGSHWFLVNMLTISMFYCFYKRNESKYFYKILFILFGLGASISFSTGLFTFPALIAAYFLAHRPSFKKIFIYIVPIIAFIIASLIFSYNLSTSNTLIDIKVIIPVLISSIFMFGMATGYLATAVMLGALIIVFMCKTALTIKNIQDSEEKEINIFWLGLSIYCMVCMLAIGLGRFNEHTINYIGYSRYQLLPAILFISTFILYTSNKPQIPKKLFATFVLATICLTYTKGKHYLDYHRLGQDRNDLNAYSLPLNDFFIYNLFNITDKDENSTRMSDVTDNSIKLLKRYNNIPFDENRWNICQKMIKNGLPENIKEDPKTISGLLSRGSDMPNHNWHKDYHEILLYGFSETPWECILTTDSDNNIIGGGHMAKYTPPSQYKQGQQLYRTFN